MNASPTCALSRITTLPRNARCAFYWKYFIYSRFVLSENDNCAGDYEHNYSQGGRELRERNTLVRLSVRDFRHFPFSFAFRNRRAHSENRHFKRNAATFQTLDAAMKIFSFRDRKDLHQTEEPRSSNGLYVLFQCSSVQSLLNHFLSPLLFPRRANVVTITYTELHPRPTCISHFAADFTRESYILTHITHHSTYRGIAHVHECSSYLSEIRPSIKRRCIYLNRNRFSKISYRCAHLYAYAL